MNERQLKAFVAQAFSLQNTADRAVLDVDALLGRVMADVRSLVQTLPEENLLRDKAWKELKPLIEFEMEPYAQGLKQAVEQQETASAPDMAAYAEREAKYAGAQIRQSLGAPLQSSVVEQVNRARVGKARFRELFMPKQGPITPWTQQMFKVVDRNVRGGIIQGLTTQEIADQVVHETISGGIPGVSLRGQTSARQIRAQAMAMSRTVTQDVNRQVKEEVWEANSEALEDFVYQFSAALDSRTCQTCAPLDGRRYDKKADAPVTPLHVNCRCQVLLIDPEDEFWDEGKRTGQQISETPYATGYKTKVKVKGEKFYRKAKEFSGNDYGDYLASSNLTTQTEFFGGGPIGKRRANYFRSQLGKVNKDPQDILSSMLTGPTNAKKFIPLPELAKRNAAAIKQKAVVKVKPKPPVTVAPKPVVDIAKSFDDSKNSLGRGLFGEARIVDSGVTKRGWLSKNELDALEALKDTGVTPKPLGVSFVDKEWNTTLYKGMKVRKGYLAMDKAPGETIGKILDFGGGFTERQSREVTDSLLRARKKFHLKGVAHQDMHGNNVLYDLKSKQMTIIDLGTARIDARSALVEALGTNRGRMSFGQVEVPGDYQSKPTFTLLNKFSKLSGNPVWKRFIANRKAVEAKLKAEGVGSILEASIRRLPRDVTRNLSQARALELLEELYEGI